MTQTELLERARHALKLVNSVEDSERNEGLKLLDEVLESRSEIFVDYGYDKLILKELMKAAKFESLPNLSTIFVLLQKHYTNDTNNQDEIMETLLYIYGLTCNFEVAKVCVDQISVLINQMGDNVAKHSKQIMQAAEMNNFISLNETFIEILEKLKEKLPSRKVTS
jgi:hypothetical protein